MAKRKKFRMNKVSYASETIFHVIIAAFALMCIIPFIFIIIIAFSSAESLRTVGYSFFPTGTTMINFNAAFEMGDLLWRSFANSVFITIVGTFLALLISSMYAYGLYRSNYPLKKFFMFLMFFTMIFGGGLVPFVIVIRNLLGLADTIWALIVPMLMAPFHVIILRTFYRTCIPESLLDAANIDGAGEFRTFFMIVIPLSKPGLATIGLMTAIGFWNDWWHALLFIRDRSLIPLQFLLMEMQRNIDFFRRHAAMIGATNIDMTELPTQGLRMALAVIIVVPIAFAYPFFQRYIISGMTIGAVKE
ncbi:MAG: carbohydrate ABC transporter permease [Oscillospiraceae bacterium]|nr:carbohydrate ABC transporter permease [Oscillospiraceae bacterium]